MGRRNVARTAEWTFHAEDSMSATAPLKRRRARAAAELDRSDGDSIDQYLREVGRFPLLTVREENELGTRARAGNDAAVAELVSRNLRFVISVAKKYQNRGLPLSDLIGEGNVGLLTAARKFDPAQGVRFISYAVWWIRQGILSALARLTHIVRVPSNRSLELVRIGRTSDVLRQRLQREPSLVEIAEASGATTEVVRAAMVRATGDVSLDSPLNDNGDQTLLDRYDIYDQAESDFDAPEAGLRERLELALSQLGDRDAKIVRLYFGLEGGREHTLEEIGRLLGVTRERVRQLRDRALRLLRSGSPARVLEDFAGEGRGKRRSSGGRETPEQRCGGPRRRARRPPDRFALG